MFPSINSTNPYSIHAVYNLPTGNSLSPSTSIAMAIMPLAEKSKSQKPIPKFETGEYYYHAQLAMGTLRPGYLTIQVLIMRSCIPSGKVLMELWQQLFISPRGGTWRSRRSSHLTTPCSACERYENSSCSSSFLRYV